MQHIICRRSKSVDAAPSTPIELTRLFLVAYVASYHTLVYPDRTDIVPACQEGRVFASHPLQLRIVVKQLQKTLTFQTVLSLRHEILLRYIHRLRCTRLPHITPSAIHILIIIQKPIGQPHQPFDVLRVQDSLYGTYSPISHVIDSHP